MNISIFGLGYVGAVSLACLARDGHHVIGVDVDPYKLDLIRQGKSPIVEVGIQELMAQVVSNGKVAVTSDVAEALNRSDIAFVCVGTPSAVNGSQDQSALLKVAEQIGDALKTKGRYHLIVYRSTVMPGTVEEVIIPLIERRSGRRPSVDFDVCFQPEFLREGTSIKDYDQPPFTIVGTDSNLAQETLRTLFGHLSCEFIATKIRTAEMVKYCCNSFHALKITFANEVGRLCGALNVNPFEVMDLVCRDKQLNISAAYLQPGYAFGGSCLPKDLRAMTYMARQRDVELPTLNSLLPSNRAHIDLAIQKVLDTRQRKVGLIGLAFKSGTDDLRESPLVEFVERLMGKGLQLAIYDPDVLLSRLRGTNKRYVDEHIPHIAELLRASPAEVVGFSELLILGTADKYLLAELKPLLTMSHHVIDIAAGARNIGLVCNYEGLC
jgi:GDP-mannose 6-dehydrogenase